MKKFILRVMAGFMAVAMIGTCLFSATKALAAEGDFSGQYPGDYQAEWIPASAFEGCEDGAVVTFTCKKDEAWANPYWQYSYIDNTWAKLLDESLYAEGGRPNFNPYEFCDVADSDTATFSPEGVKAIIAAGNLGIQCAGIVPLSWTVNPVATEEPEAPVVEEPVEEPEAPVVDEPVAEEPIVGTTDGREVKEGETVYVVQPGDCLWAIARTYLGIGQRYTELFERNSDIVKVAELIYPGQEIIIPAQ